LRSHQSIELLQKKALVAAKAWVSLYRKLEVISNLGGVIIHTSGSNGQIFAVTFYAKKRIKAAIKHLRG